MISLHIIPYQTNRQRMAGDQDMIGGDRRAMNPAGPPLETWRGGGRSLSGLDFGSIIHRSIPSYLA